MEYFSNPVDLFLMSIWLRAQRKHWERTWKRWLDESSVQQTVFNMRQPGDFLTTGSSSGGAVLPDSVSVDARRSSLPSKVPQCLTDLLPKLIKQPTWVHLLRCGWHCLRDQANFVICIKLVLGLITTFSPVQRKLIAVVVYQLVYKEMMSQTWKHLSCLPRF